MSNTLHHHSQLSSQLQQQQSGYATTHRTFPSAHTSDLIFSSLNRKLSRNGTLLSERGGGGSSGSDEGRSGRLWYADIIHNHPQNNHNGGGGGGPIYSSPIGGSNGGHGSHHPPQILPQQQQLPQVLPNGRHNGFLPYTNGRNGIKSNHHGGGGGVSTLNPNAFPLIRGNEINV